MKLTRNGVLALGLAVLTIILDQASKAYMVGPFHLLERGSVAVAPFFHLTAVSNPGVSFGFLSADTPLGRWGLVAFASVVVIALGVWAAGSVRLISALALGLIIGGAAGNNLIDRVRLGSVIDFLDFTRMGFPWVFNVADSAITVGVALLLLDSFLTPQATSTPQPKT